MLSQCTKFELSRLTRYEAMNGGAKCRKWDGFGAFRGTQGQRQCHHSIERMQHPIRLETLIGSMCLSSTVFDI